MRAAIILSLTFLWSIFCYAQKTTLEINPEKTEIGKAVVITLKHQNKENVSIHFPSPNQIQENFRNVASNSQLDMDIFFSDTIYKTTDEYYWIRSFILTPWDTGIYILSGEDFFINNEKIDLPKSLLAIHSNEIPNNSMYTLKEKFTDVDFNNSYNMIWLFSLLFGIFGVGIWFFLRFRHKKNNNLKKDENIPLVEIYPLDKAKLELKRLRLLELWKTEKKMEHYTQLSIIIKQYIGEEYGQNCLEKTTSDIAAFLKIKKTVDKTTQKIISVLEETDNVKFGSVEIDEERIKATLQKTEYILMEMDQELRKTVKDV